MRLWLAVLFSLVSGFALAQTSTEYTCANDVRLSLRFSDQKAELVFGGQTHNLAQRPSGSGVQYSDGTFVWYGKGQEGFLGANGARVAEDCRAVQGANSGPFRRRSVNYLCEAGVNVRAVYTREQVAVIFKNQTYTLPQVVSGSGFRYSNGRAEWRGEGRAATLSSLRTGQALAQNCREVSMDGVLNGTVIYLPRIALPPQAVIQVQLQDVSRMDAPATVLAEQIIQAEGRQVPFPFELRYDASQIQPERTYALRVRITVDGQLRFTNPSSYPVLTGGAPLGDLEVRVEPVR